MVPMKDGSIENILITGGTGFIGSHLTDELLRNGYNVRILDNLSPRVYGAERKIPQHFNSRAGLIVGDIRDAHAVREALEGIDAVVHLAAAVSMRQSMYEIEKCMSTNSLGTAVLLEALIQKPVKKLVVASSCCIYGEGLYCSYDGTLYPSVERLQDKLRAGDWEARGPGGEVLLPLPTPETKEPCPTSIYALSKYDQERMSMMIGNAYGIPTVALRLFNVFGPRQGFANPYTGMLTMIASSLLQDEVPRIPEDGHQQRDYVSVHDAVQAFRLALKVPEAAGSTFNIGSGRSYTLKGVAELMARAAGKEHLQPEITGTCRLGDIRHCLADISLARQVLGYEPKVSLPEGFLELAGWLSEQDAAIRRPDLQHLDTEAKGLAYWRA